MNRSNPVVVVVDDSPSVKSLFEHSTASLGVELKTFSSAASSLAYLNSQKPALLFLNIIMPDKDGLTFLRELRGNPLHEDTAVIMISSKDYAQDRHAAWELGALEFISKPMPMQAITEAVKKHIS
ncbi:DNA-binding response OmpR family regulator [Methylohalomonas lacus]|uniref:DNA-binding response OmpR family regulator n=1 Tax=Methylohalomonas lacus TaxID=398773 RepID=A0AAE3HMZ2_9GAMM|nr:response regulator [Methylohalomonas lacus]MCS3904147.1 DNA-binding response OmpR family regulator [Methylohalomonas lacus]